MNLQYLQHLPDRGAVQRPRSLAAQQVRPYKRRLPAMLIGIVSMSLMVCGCGSALPALTPPDIDPSTAADNAFANYDKDENGLLSAEELQACPPLAGSISNYDTDSDAAISRAELAQRLQRFVNSRAALYRLSVTVYLDNRPLPGATVKFVPESYFEDQIKTATGITGRAGSAQMAVADEDLPENQRNIRAVQCGSYRVEITHPEIEIPSRYNTATTLGYESVISEANVEFKLKSRQ